jgi:hypothetical protein
MGKPSDSTWKQCAAEFSRRYSSGGVDAPAIAERCLEIALSTFPKNDVRVARSLNDSALSKAREQKLGEAEAAYRRAWQYGKRLAPGTKFR